MLTRLLAASLLLAAPLADADTLLLEGIRTAQASAEARPARGMSMDAVQSAFGSPSVRQDAVGTYAQCAQPRFCPPITRWEYPDFTVYFEHERVVHAVSTR